MSRLIKTNISNAYWCSVNGFEAAERPQFHDAQRERFFDITRESRDSIKSISWFDTLFDGGGIEIPDEQGKPIIMLLSGPPGSGKTTLALELCLRVAICHGFWSLYISTESETEQLTKKAHDLGIHGSAGRIFAFNKDIKRLDALTIYGQENIQKWETFSEIVKLAVEDVITWLTRTELKLVKKLLAKSKTTDTLNDFSPDILVFDNLNMVKHEERHEFFEKIVKGRYSKTKLIIVILDSHTYSQDHEAWEFACDTILRLDYSYIKLDETSLRDYFLRQIEVVKARYQAHVWGKQQLKIYKPFELDENDPNYDAKLKRAHPFRREGGIFIYPSIHYYLSEYKRRGITLKVNPVPTPVKGLNELVKEGDGFGFPEGRCTALMGCRGAHKSHLAYLHLLERVIESNKKREKEAGIIISLRDDEEMTRQHLSRILSEKLIKEEYGTGRITETQRNRAEKDAEGILDNILREMDLEILYYPPGYITADEFFHRMFMSVYRLRKQKRKITLLFNSLDQISARFPLCAHQPIFVPAMIEALSGEKVTSIFIGVDEPGQPPTQYGLLPMADLILNFDRYKIRERDYYELHKQTHEGSGDYDKYIDAILLEVSRFAGGQQAGKRGLWELVYSDSASASLIKEPGLHFNEWKYEYFKPEGIK